MNSAIAHLLRLSISLFEAIELVTFSKTPTVGKNVLPVSGYVFTC